MPTAAAIAFERATHSAISGGWDSRTWYTAPGNSVTHAVRATSDADAKNANCGRFIMSTLCPKSYERTPIRALLARLPRRHKTVG
jgi:hypothetical protein